MGLIGVCSVCEGVGMYPQNQVMVVEKWRVIDAGSNWGDV